MVSQYNLSEWEQVAYYHGISSDPPPLLYRSDYRETPFPRPTGRLETIPSKTIHGIWNTPLHPIWGTVAPQILDKLKDRKIRYTSLTAVRFKTHDEDGQGTLGPVVIWVTTHPASTTAEDAHLASADILALLEVNGVHSAVVEWTEGVVERL